MNSDHGEGAGQDPEPDALEEFDPDAEMAALLSSQAPRFERYDCTGSDPAVLSAATDAARQAVERGDCVVLPTDTVYGIGADAFSPQAVQRLLDAKNRGRDMPPPVLIAEPGLMRVLAIDVPEDAKRLVSKHWPGPLTIICRAQPSLRLDLGDTQGTIALRVPDHALARDLLRQIGPMAVSSANLSGRPAATTCEEAVEQLGDRVAVYLDGGRSGTVATAPSTMVDFSQVDSGEVLRHGALSVEKLRETCPDLVDLAPADAEGPDSQGSDSQGRGTPGAGSHVADPEDAAPGSDEPAGA